MGVGIRACSRAGYGGGEREAAGLPSPAGLGKHLFDALGQCEQGTGYIIM